MRSRQGERASERASEKERERKKKFGAGAKWLIWAACLPACLQAAELTPPSPIKLMLHWRPALAFARLCARLLKRAYVSACACVCLCARPRERYSSSPPLALQRGARFLLTLLHNDPLLQHDGNLLMRRHIGCHPPVQTLAKGIGQTRRPFRRLCDLFCLCFVRNLCCSAGERASCA